MARVCVVCLHGCLVSDHHEKACGTEGQGQTRGATEIGEKRGRGTQRETGHIDGGEKQNDVICRNREQREGPSLRRKRRKKTKVEREMSKGPGA